MKEKLMTQSLKSALLCKTSDLKEAMKFLNRAVPKTAIGKLYACEITIKTNEVLFVAIGVSRVLYCKSSGPVKISIPLFYFHDIVKNIKSFSTEILIEPGIMMIGNLKVMVNTCFFENDAILRSINLPINFSADDIIRLPTKYTPEELEFNKINELIRKTHCENAKGILKKPQRDKSIDKQLKLNLL